MPLHVTDDGSKPSLQLTFGAIEVGVSVAMFLQGICTLQAWNYYRDYPNDARHLKIMVAIIYILDLVHCVLIVHAIHHYTIDCFGDYHCLELAFPSINLSVGFVGAVAFVVQGFYCLRVFRVTGSKLLGLLCAVLTIARFAFNITTVAFIFYYGDFESALSKFRWTIISTLTIGTASDVCIAACICWGLLSRRSGFAPTDRLIDRLVGFVIGSGLLTSVVAVVEVVLYATRNDFIWLAFFAVLAKLFSNSLLASLNERRILNQMGTTESREELSMPPADLRQQHVPPPPSNRVSHSPGGGIFFAKSPSNVTFELEPGIPVEARIHSATQSRYMEQKGTSGNYFQGRESP